MRKKDKFLLVLKKIREILNKNYPFKKKYEEIKLLGFKIHPIFGNIEALKRKEEEIVTTLWQINKIEEIIYKNYKNITFEELNVIFDFIDFLKTKNQSFKNSEEFLSTQNLNDRNFNLEMEIFQEKPSSKKTIN